MQAIGGLQVAFDMWELAAVSSLLTNCESWFGITPSSLEQLENLQFMFLRLVLKVPWSTAKPALTWETGTLPMKFRIMSRKLTFINNIKHQSDDSLAKQVLVEQINNEWPGLAKEAKEMCAYLNIADITRVDVGIMTWKNTVM